MVIKSLQSNHILIDLRPNKSATWYSTKWAIALLFFVMSTIAVGWALVGVWVILPFAGIEFCVFTFLIYHVCKQTYRYQRIYVYADYLKFEWIDGKQYHLEKLSRKHLYVRYIETKRDWQLPKLTISNLEKKVEVGEFLNLKDKEQLKHLLEDIGLIVIRKHWWKH